MRASWVGKSAWYRNQAVNFTIAKGAYAVKCLKAISEILIAIPENNGEAAVRPV